MDLNGTLRMFPLRELIEMAAYSSVTGALDVAGRQSGRIYFHNGQLYHAEWAGQSGGDALGALLEEQDGRFGFTSATAAPAQTIWGDIDTTLRTAERVGLRWRRIRPLVPSLDLVPVLAVPREAAERSVGVEHHLLLDTIDGRGSVAAIGARLGWSAIDVAEGVAQLCASGMLTLVDASQLPPPQPAPAAPPARPAAAPPAESRILALLRA